MTSYLKYYSKENARHATTEKVSVNIDLAVAMTKALFKFFKVPTIKVKLIDKKVKQFKRLRKVKSWYHTSFYENKREIVYHPSMLNPLTVAHEVAHYVDDYRARQAKRSRGRWHSVVHRQLTDSGVYHLTNHPLFSQLFKKDLEGDLARDEAALQSVLTHGEPTPASPPNVEAT